MNDGILVTKTSGEQEPFQEAKLRRSLEKAGAKQELIDLITSDIGKKIFSGIPTSLIYSYASELLKKSRSSLAAKYNLKLSIMELGPSGFPFEKFVAEIFRSIGYKVKVGEIVQGECVPHEIDIIAERDNELLMAECKYHNRQGYTTDVKIALYVQARYEDVRKRWLQAPELLNKSHQHWLVTNTKCSNDAIRYAECVGMKILAWNYPENNGLKEMIERSGLNPITSLTTLSKKQKDRLLSQGIVTCKDLTQQPPILKSMGFNKQKIDEILIETLEVCSLSGSILIKKPESAGSLPLR
ncbi:MAG: restriction endonuclease [Actinobacteria bacterium]|nr:restriction endonuclease [Actinomycetota bacterium]